MSRLPNFAETPFAPVATPAPQAAAEPWTTPEGIDVKPVYGPEDLAGLDWIAGHRPQAAWLLSVAADTPFIPDDLAARLHHARAAAGTPLARAASGGQPHHATGLWPVALREELRRDLAAGERRLGRWTQGHGVAVAEWPAEPVDPFFNVNTPEDLAEAERLAASAIEQGSTPSFRGRPRA